MYARALRAALVAAGSGSAGGARARCSAGLGRQAEQGWGWGGPRPGDAGLRALGLLPTGVHGQRATHLHTSPHPEGLPTSPSPSPSPSEKLLPPPAWLTSHVHSAASEDADRQELLHALIKGVRVREPRDLALLHEGDLVAHGVRPPVARRFAAQVGPQAAATTSSSESDLSPEQAAMLALQQKGVFQTRRALPQALGASFLGGAYLGWGGALMCYVSGNSAAALAPGLLALLKGMVFPVGLSMIILSNSELMTGNFLTQSLPPLGAAPLADRARVLAVSGLGNLAGSLTVVGLVSAMNVFPLESAAAAAVASMAAAKCALPTGTAFVKGVGANWLVAVAIYQAATAKTTPGKVTALWMPIATFVTLGLEHSVANMFLLPLGWALGADITAVDMLANLAPVAAGNAVGAGLFVGGLQWLSVFGSSRQQ